MLMRRDNRRTPPDEKIRDWRTTALESMELPKNGKGAALESTDVPEKCERAPSEMKQGKTR
jgi:hypothetical protein